jgi:hypothetical protein
MKSMKTMYLQADYGGADILLASQAKGRKLELIVEKEVSAFGLRDSFYFAANFGVGKKVNRIARRLGACAVVYSDYRGDERHFQGIVQFYR